VGRRNLRLAYWHGRCIACILHRLAGASNEREGRMSTTVSIDRVADWRQSKSRSLRAVVVVFAAIGLTLIPLMPFGFFMSGWAWLLELVVLIPLAVSAPLSRSATRCLLPYTLFLLYASSTLAWSGNLQKGIATLTQFAVPAAAYLVAWRVPAHVDVERFLSKTCLLVLALAVVLVAVFTPILGSPFGDRLGGRPASVSAVVLFVVATLTSRSWRITLLLGAVTLTLAMSTGSRMSSAVVIIMLLTSPALGLRWQGRVLIAALFVVLVLFISQTETFKERFFFSEDASLIDVITLSNDVNTSGRRELWPSLQQECSRTSLTGEGIGTASLLSTALSEGALSQPHNDYLRTYCEVGLVGSGFFWALFAWAGLRSWRGAFVDRSVRLHAAAGQLIIALLIFSITDNPIIYTAQFMAPMAVILGLSDRALFRAGRLWTYPLSHDRAGA
jgi:O-antigen ligase